MFAIPFSLRYADTIHDLGSVVGDKQGPVWRNRHSYWPSIHIRSARIRHQSRQERHGIRRRLAIFERHERHLVAEALRAVPRTVLHHKRSAPVAFGNL